ncbi:hypothetical protein TRIATDRAFT_310795 [Trichoderma atroviride IMI 206040]|uniref:Nucleoside phosphorylase domain-containing protein n=2 Tax=Hypocrea atroviridis TaxID=63577 RepID=G9P103_HYPAI|nr:uncharacterized protein TRIATDRAFT_310795 [Trichoderma atroviride IMI 206040]EHK43250.1 hypothetical protein TRIATDRAFT_310795 [Trichoderma atroviride IMI 206040]
MSDPDSYTVGWICALPIEFVAAQSLLDERHEPLASRSPGDINSYTLGSIGNHRVVIAINEYGTTEAASVARDMLGSFRNIRIGLMVGIGSGAPSRRNDIRLGDVVVGAGRDGNGGVLQYDFTRTIQDQAFQVTGVLNQPPAILSAAISNIRAQYETHGHQLEQTITSLIQRNPRLQKRYSRPPQDKDRLYQPSATHTPQGWLNCADCGDDPLRVHIRPPRQALDDDPAVHYGLIASANQPVRDAVTRDRLATRREVLCFDTEAAGLMSHFPCVVIRGICDYADTHSNDVWQGYAAMTAAAYAKDLLLRIPAERIEAENPVSLAPPPADGNNQPGATPQNRTRYWIIIEQDSLDVVTSDITRYEALREALSNWSLQELPLLQWTGGEESRSTYITVATNAETLLQRHGLKIRRDIDAWAYVQSAESVDALSPRDKALFLGMYAGYHFAGPYAAGWARAGRIISTMSWLMEYMAVE